MRYFRRRLDVREELMVAGAAAGAAAAVGTVAWYFGRILLQRAPLRPGPPAGKPPVVAVGAPDPLPGPGARRAVRPPRG